MIEISNIIREDAFFDLAEKPISTHFSPLQKFYKHESTTNRDNLKPIIK